MKKRGYLYILLAVIVVGMAGGFTYWRYQNHENQAQRSEKKFRPRSTKVQKSPKVTSSTASAKQPKTKKTRQSTQSQRLTNYIRRGHFVGSALLVRNGQIIYRKGFGYADYETRKPNRANSQFQILSIQKSLTAVCVMKLIAAKQLSLNTKLAKFYPTIPNANRITIRSMLNMNSGLSMISDGSTALLSEKNVLKYAIRHVLSKAQSLGQWSYQPINFVLLAGIVSKLTHQTYRHNFYQTFVYPLNLRGTGFVQKWPASRYKTLGYRYQKASQVVQTYDERFIEPRAAMQNELGTGQVYMSPIDLFKTERDILKGRLISKQAVNVLHAPGSASTYGGGVYNQSNGIRSHGVGYGYEASILITRNGHTGVVLMTNNYRPARPVQDPAVHLFNDLVDGKIA